MFSLKDFGITKKFGVLDNGSKIYLYSKPNMPISTAVLFDAGSKCDPVGKEGLAHFCEHILFKSTNKFKDETEAGLFLENIGGHSNAFTGVDLLGVTADIGVKSDYPKVVDFLYELIRESLFEESKIEIERGTILGEIADYESNPALYIQDLIQKQLFQGTYAKRDVAGDGKSVSNISREDLFSFYNSNIVNGDMVVVVAGDIDFDDLLSLFNKKFKDKKNIKKKADSADLEITRKDPVGIKVYEGIDQIFLGFCFRACKYTDRDSDTLDVIKTMIGEGFSSSLFRKLRTENGLVYSLDVISECLTDRGYFSVLTSTSKNNLQKVLDILNKEFKRLENGEITEDDLILAKNKIIKSKIREMQSSGAWVGFHLPEVFFNPENPLDLSDYLNRVEQIDLNNVKEVSKKYFSNDKWYLALCGDVKESDFSVNY